MTGDNNPKSDIRPETVTESGQDTGSMPGTGASPVCGQSRLSRPKVKARYVRALLVHGSDAPARIAELAGCDLSYVYRLKRQLTQRKHRDEYDRRLARIESEYGERIRALEARVSWLTAGSDRAMLPGGPRRDWTV